MDPVLSPYEFAQAHAAASAKARQLKAVAEATSLGHSWLRKFAKGRIPGAASRKVEALVNHYRAHPAIPSGAPISPMEGAQLG